MHHSGAISPVPACRSICQNAEMEAKALPWHWYFHPRQLTFFGVKCAFEILSLESGKNPMLSTDI
jgi:hypothetical protein